MNLNNSSEDLKNSRISAISILEKLHKRDAHKKPYKVPKDERNTVFYCSSDEEGKKRVEEYIKSWRYESGIISE